MKKICVVSAARSEYGLLRWLMSDIKASNEFSLQIVVTGGHLLKDQGSTVNQIIDDGFSIDYAVDSHLDTSTTVAIAESMGRMAEGIAKAFEALQPDYVLVLGDRYELLPICNTAFVMQIPIIHLSGGDITEGAIDDGIRNAVTMLSDYHFPGTIDSAKNVVRMRGNSDRVWAVGEPGLDAYSRESLMTRDELSSNLGIDIQKRWALLTYHSETNETLEYNLNALGNCIDSLTCLDDFQIIATYANADFGGKLLNDYIEGQGMIFPDKIRVFSSLGHYRYLSLMKQVDFVIGNSSSGIVEAPCLNIPVINIGSRQKGRYQCENIIQCKADRKDLQNAIAKALAYNNAECSDRFYWGDGHTSERIVEILKREL